MGTPGPSIYAYENRYEYAAERPSIIYNGDEAADISKPIGAVLDRVMGPSAPLNREDGIGTVAAIGRGVDIADEMPADGGDFTTCLTIVALANPWPTNAPVRPQGVRRSERRIYQLKIKPARTVAAHITQNQGPLIFYDRREESGSRSPDDVAAYSAWSHPAT